MRALIFAAVAAATAAACAAAAPSQSYRVTDHAPSPQTAVIPVTHNAPVWCDIRVERLRGGGARFTPVAQAPGYVEGTFRFVLTRIDGSGSSDVEQGGDFALSPDQPLVLGSNDLSMERDARFRARLVLEDRYGVLCRQEVRS